MKLYVLNLRIRFVFYRYDGFVFCLCCYFECIFGKIIL